MMREKTVMVEQLKGSALSLVREYYGELALRRQAYGEDELLLCRRSLQVSLCCDGLI
jgi:hypothetical protein